MRDVERCRRSECTWGIYALASTPENATRGPLRNTKRAPAGHRIQVSTATMTIAWQTSCSTREQPCMESGQTALLEDLAIGCFRAEPRNYMRKQTVWGETPHPMGVEAMFNPASEQTRPDSQLFQKGSSDAIWRHSLSLPHSRNHHYPENYTSNMSEAAERF